MKFRVMLVCTLLLLAAVPSFALPQCEECDYTWNECYVAPGAVERCTYDEFGRCYTYYGRCSSFQASTVLTDWKVSSIEISRPSLDSVTVTAPAAVAKAEPVEQK